MSILGALLAATTNLAVPAAAPPPSPEVMRQGAKVYQAHCASCHDHPQGRVPARASIVITKSPDFVLQALNTGVMSQVGSTLTPADRVAVATYLMGKSPGFATSIDPNANRCAAPAGPLNLKGPSWNGWGGAGHDNIRFQRQPDMTPADVRKLKLRWAFAFPGGASSQPTVVGGHVFVPTMGGYVFSLDAKTGCTYWAVNAGAPVRSAITVGRLDSGQVVALFGDMHGDVHALNAETGKEVWRKRIDDHPMTRLTGSLTLYRDRIYAPVSSFEETSALDPNYACCTFRGSLVALDAASGSLLWKTSAIDQPLGPLGDGHRMGPAGAAIWSAPTIDPKRGLVYVTTGNGYTDPAAPTTNAVLALELKTGVKQWVKQLTPGDAYVSGCFDAKGVNCPKGDLGPDFDFGSSSLLVTAHDSRQRLVLTSKSGMAFGLDPDHAGKVLWSTAVGRGGLMGGAVWGGASDGERVFIPITDLAGRARDPHGRTGSPVPGLYALSASTGAIVWTAPAPHPVCDWGGPCFAAYYSAPAVIPGVVFSGAFDGHERAYSTRTGALIWDFDSAKSFAAVNGGQAQGGSIDQGGQTVAGGQLYLSSGARSGYPGDALLVFGPDRS